MTIDDLDAQVWAWANAMTQEPERAARLLDRRRGRDAAEHAAATLAGFDRQFANYVDNLWLVTGHAASLVREKIDRLDGERQKLVAERETVAARLAATHDRRERAERMIWTCVEVRSHSQAQAKTFVEKRQALSDLGATVWLYPDGSPDQWTATFAFDLDGRGERTHGRIVARSSSFALIGRSTTSA